MLKVRAGIQAEVTSVIVGELGWIVEVGTEREKASSL